MVIARRPMPRHSKSLWSYNPIPTGCVLYLPLWSPGLRGSPFKSIDLFRHTCTVFGALWTPNGRVFDGDDKIDIPFHSSLAMTNALTCMAWFNQTTTSGSRGGLINKVGDDYIFSVDSTNKLTAYIEAGIPAHDLADTVLNNDTWYFGVLTWDGSNKRFYVDAVPDGVVAAVGTITDDGFDMTIGSAALTSQYFTGLIGEALIYNRVLSQAEITFLYNRTKWRYPK